MDLQVPVRRFWRVHWQQVAGQMARAFVSPSIHPRPTLVSVLVSEQAGDCGVTMATHSDVQIVDRPVDPVDITVVVYTLSPSLF